MSTASAQIQGQTRIWPESYDIRAVPQHVVNQRNQDIYGPYLARQAAAAEKAADEAEKRGQILTAAVPARPSEKSFVQMLAHEYGADSEVRLWDGTRADLVGESWVAEVDFEEKWAEAIGQALYYGLVCGKKPRIILLVKKSTRPSQHVYRCQTVVASIPNLKLLIYTY